ncbi:hypothetical protein LINPERHAP1_LOCUS19008 [Linum perenne]
MGYCWTREVCCVGSTLLQGCCGCCYCLWYNKPRVLQESTILG